MKEVVIKPKPPWKLIDIEEIYRYRELLYIFVWRDVKARYKQTMLGVLWVVFQPLVTMIIFTVFFGSLAKIKSGDLPYSLFVFCGLVFWSFFSTSLTYATDSLVSNRDIIKKVYFPRILMPLASVTIGLVDFFINMLILLAFSLILGFIPNMTVIYLFPFAIILTYTTALGVGLIFSSLNVKYRDVRYVLPFFIQLLLFLTPVIFPLGIVSGNKRLIMALNPITSVVEMTRHVVSSDYQIFPELIVISLISASVLMLVGLWYFSKTEQYFSDLI